MENREGIDVTPYLEGRISNQQIYLFYRGERVATIPFQWEHVEMFQHPHFYRQGGRIYFYCEEGNLPATYAQDCDLGWC